MASDVLTSTGDSEREPFSLEAEQAVLGAVISDPSCFPRAAMILKPGDFYLPLHRDIFTAITALDAQKSGRFDAVMLIEALRRNNSVSEQESKEYIFELVRSVPSTENIEYYAKIVKDKFYIRALIDFSRETIDTARAGSDTAEEMLDAAEQKLYDIRQGQSVRGPERLSDILPNVFSDLSLLASPDAEQYKGLPTGFPDLDASISGLNKSDLVLIGARPAMGKTSFALNLARNVCVKSKRRVLFFSLEMSKEQLATRLLSTEARIESGR